MGILYLLTTDTNVTWQGAEPLLNVNMSSAHIMCFLHSQSKVYDVNPLKANLKLILLIRLFFDDIPNCLISLSNFSVVYKLSNQHDFKSNFQFFLMLSKY